MENCKLYKLKEFDVFIETDLKAIFIDFKKSPSCIIVKFYEGKKERFTRELISFLTNELGVLSTNFNLIQFTFIGTTIIFNRNGNYYILDSVDSSIHNKSMYSYIQEVMNEVNLLRKESGFYGCQNS